MLIFQPILCLQRRLFPMGQLRFEDSRTVSWRCAEWPRSEKPRKGAAEGSRGFRRMT
jgi:hypothetical protein